MFVLGIYQCLRPARQGQRSEDLWLNLDGDVEVLVALACELFRRIGR